MADNEAPTKPGSRARLLASHDSVEELDWSKPSEQRFQTEAFTKISLRLPYPCSRRSTPGQTDRTFHTKVVDQVFLRRHGAGVW